MAAWRAFALLGACVLVLFRVWRVLGGKPGGRRTKQRSGPAAIVVVLGSGGHTTEMLRYVGALPGTRYGPRLYVVGADDELGRRKAERLEQTTGKSQASFLRMPRPRRVHQSWWSTPWSTVWSLVFVVWTGAVRPALDGRGRRQTSLWTADVVLMNGPGACVPLALVALLPRVFGWPGPTLVYVESWARAERLSLTGRLIRPLVDRFVVQWRELKDRLDGQRSLLDTLGLGCPVDCVMLAT